MMSKEAHMTEQPQTEAERLAQWLERCAESIEQINAANLLRALAAELAQAKAQCAGYLEQHHRDSAELRRLCQARDDEAKARRAAQEALYAERDRCTEVVKAEQRKHSATLAELEGLKAQGQWLPIETAPVSTRVLAVWRPVDHKVRTFHKEIVTGSRCHDFGTGLPTGVFYSGGMYYDEALHVTHWRPLPAPPTGEV